MLTDTDRARIREEEAFRKEINDKRKDPKSFFDKMDGPIKLLGGLAVAVGIYLSIFQYMENSKNQRIEAAREYQKSFYQAQMAVYAEAVTATSIIATADTASIPYKDHRDKFYALFWGRMSMFEDKCVEAKMVEFRKLLLKFENKDFNLVRFRDPCTGRECTIDSVSQVALKFASLALANQCRIYTIRTWLPEEERSSYNMYDTTSCPHN